MARTLAQIREEFATYQIKRVRLGITDTDGVLRGKYISVDKFETAANEGLGFCDVIFGWDLSDTLCENLAHTGWHTGYPDAWGRIDLDTFRILPWEPGTAFFLFDLCAGSGAALSL
jgi:glutamine synthetase